MKNLIIVLLSFLLLNTNLYAQVTIQMEKDGGVYKVPCKVNGLKLKFIFDTGASTVSLSSTIANMMLENDYLKKTDIHGSGASVIADGSIVDHTKITLREIEIGGLTLRDVEAVVIHNQDSPLLLGLSAIRKLGKVTISGNILTIDTGTVSSVSGTSMNYSSDDLFQFYKEAIDYYDRELYLLAVEKFDILYQNDCLLLEDMQIYADCLFNQKRYKEALDVYLSIEDWTKKRGSDNLGSLYNKISSVAFFLGQYQTSIRYGQLATSLLNILDNVYFYSTYWIFSSYNELGDTISAQNVLEDYLKKYFAAHGISATDCWTKGYKDPNIADAYFSMCFLYPSFSDAKKYLFISAAWGNEKAIEECRNNVWNYSIKPYEYVY